MTTVTEITVDPDSRKYKKIASAGQKVVTIVPTATNNFSGLHITLSNSQPIDETNSELPKNAVQFTVKQPSTDIWIRGAFGRKVLVFEATAQNEEVQVR